MKVVLPLFGSVFFCWKEGCMDANLRSWYRIEADVWISTLDSVIPTKAHQNNIARDELSIAQKLDVEIVS